MRQTSTRFREISRHTSSFRESSSSFRRCPPTCSYQSRYELSPRTRVPDFASQWKIYTTQVSTAAGRVEHRTVRKGDFPAAGFFDQDPGTGEGFEWDSFPDPAVLQLPDGDRETIPMLNGFGKWHSLSIQPDRLALESNMMTRRLKLIDDPENQDDLFLWAVLLEFRLRRDGHSGARDILKGLLARRTLRDVHGRIANAFWRTIHREALQDDTMMDEVWEYAEWLLRNHSTRWPNLYWDTITFFMENGKYGRAILWDTRLSPSFGLDDRRFSEILKRFIMNADLNVQSVLRRLYRTSSRRSLYDSLVPYLYESGNLSLARRWRLFLLASHDGPKTKAAQPFLQCLAGYCPEDRLTRSEILVAGLDGHDQDPGPGPTEEGEGALETTRHLQYNINRILGQTFGIKEKTYDDSLLARWFASSWISVDLAIDVARMLGVDRIGPLSLQSLALREENASRLSARLEQLEGVNVDIGNSNYAKAIRHFANFHNEDTLHDLLHSDIHPDVFDDEPELERVLLSASTAGDLKLQQLIMSVRLAVSMDTVVLASNRLLCAHLARGNRHMILRTIRSMLDRNIQILPSTSNAISTHILEKVSPLHEGEDHHSFYGVLCYKIAPMRFPLATRVVQTLLNKLCRAGKLGEVERLALRIAESYKAAQISEWAMFYVHQFDTPTVLQSKSGNQLFRPVPRDLDTTNHRHPLSLIFNAYFQRRILRNGFRWALNTPRLDRSGGRLPGVPADFGFARGLRFLALLRENGVHVDTRVLRKEVHEWLALLYDPTASGKRPRPYVEALRRANQLDLEQARALCDDAWGSAIAPRHSERDPWDRAPSTTFAV